MRKSDKKRLSQLISLVHLNHLEKQETKLPIYMRSKPEKYFKANLIKYRAPNSEFFEWLWVSSDTGNPLSPRFGTQKEAEIWFNDVVKIHNETYHLLTRLQEGKIYKIKGIIDSEHYESVIKTKECKFTKKMDDNIASFEVLAVSEDDAKIRITREGVEVMEWIENE